MSEHGAPELIEELRGPVMWLTVNREERRNAIGPARSHAAIRRGLCTMKEIEAMSFDESIAFTESQIGRFVLTEDVAQGQPAFREKRKLVRTGH